jgi:hypothetical protein
LSLSDLNEPTRNNYVVMIAQCAAQGMNDPEISSFLRGGLTPDEVGRLRRQEGIKAGQRFGVRKGSG